MANTLSINLITPQGTKEQEYNLPKFVLDASAYGKAVEYNYFVKCNEKIVDAIGKKETTIAKLFKCTSDEDKLALEKAKVELTILKKQKEQLETIYARFTGDSLSTEERQTLYNNKPARNMVLTFLNVKPSITRMATLYDFVVSYYNTYEGKEEWDAPRKADFANIKSIMTEILADRFNITKDSDPMYKSHTVRLSSAFVEGCINFVYGDYARNKASNMAAKRKTRESLYVSMVKRYFSEIEHKNPDTTLPKTAKEVTEDTF